MINNLILDFDDFHWQHPQNCLETIDLLLTYVPNIKLSFFVAPNWEDRPLYKNPIWCDKVRRLIKNNNVVLGIHGLCHSQLEFSNKTKSEALLAIGEAEKEFQKADLPFVKVFKGPHWGLNSDTVDALIEKEYSHIYSHEDFKHLEKPGIKFVYYDINLKDKIDKDYLSNTELDVIAHGHSWDVCNNGIKESAIKIINLCERSRNYKFINEV